MKVAIFTNEFPPNIYGGAGVHVDYLTRELAKLVDVEVHCFGEQNLTHGRLRVHGHKPWSGLGGRDKRYDRLWDTFSADLAMAAALREADIVHCHTWYSHLAGLIAKQLCRAALITTTHSLEPSRPWKAEQLGNAYHVSSWVERMVMEQADGVIAVSEGMKRDALRCFNIPADKIEVIHNGIDLAEYKPVSTLEALKKYKVAADKPYVLFVGRITRQKGIIHLVRAIPFIDRGAQIVLCAGTPDTEDIAREMRQAVADVRKGRNDIIWIEEMVSRSEAIEFYSHAAVFCCPSVYEPFGIINLEAMACGTAVVGSKVGGIPEIIVDGETGYLVEYENADAETGEPKEPTAYSRALAEKINIILRDGEKQERFGHAGRKRVEEKFSWSAIARQTLDFYQQVSGKKVRL